MRANFVQACALALALMGCATVPTLHGAPEDIANQMGANAVAYNQAYGRAIADQVLLNILRARDRQPLYHLSMSGITDNSELTQEVGAQAGGVSLGNGNGGVGQLSGGRTLMTKPTYSLNPFSSEESTARARQFERAAPEALQHYWTNGWPIEVLLYVMVEEIVVEQPGLRDPAVRIFNNSSSGYRGDCALRTDYAPAARETPRQRTARLAREARETEQERQARLAHEAAERRCGFVWVTQTIADARQRAMLAPSASCAQNTLQQQHTCEIRIDPVDGTTPNDAYVYRVNLRSIDDMLYFVGSVLRRAQSSVSDEEPTQSERRRDPEVMETQIRIRPSNVYTADGEHWTAIERSSPLFAIREAPRRYAHGDYAAEVTYRGVRYVAGPADSVICVGATNCNGRASSRVDASSRVLSLLTQLVIISQSEEAQLAPRPAADSD